MAGKRKREDTNGEVENHFMNGGDSEQHQQDLQLWLSDVLEVLKKHDTNPSTLSYPINSPSTALFSSGKRPKLSDPHGKITITSLVESKAYAAVEELVSDLDSAVSSVVSIFRDHSDIDQSAASTAERNIGRAFELKKELQRLVLAEMTQRRNSLRLRTSDEGNPPKEEETKHSKHPTNARAKTVLTLYGGERQAKQLFSSLANSETLDSELNEQTLPNGITTTTVIPAHSLQEAEGKYSAPTLGTVFASSNTRPFNPPKPLSKNTATRSSSVNWYNPADALSAPKEPSLRDSYYRQPLSSGQWLSYNVVPSSAQLASPETKRKQRDRALSFGESQPSISEEAIAAHNQAKEEALFRSAYSSFAPDRDDSGALVSEQQKNHLWWTRHGEAEYQDLLDKKIYDALQPTDTLETERVADNDDIDDEVIEEAIANWEPQDASEAMKEQEGNTANKDTDDLLQEISELLEVLNSHQRIRNLSQVTNTRTMPGQNAQLASMPGGPSSPSSAEFDVYETLKSQLVLIVSSLPPYLLAKLDGDRLGALNVSTRMSIPAMCQKGTMAEDELSARAKATVRNGAAGPTPQAGPYSVPPGRNNSFAPATSTATTHYAQRHAYGPQSVPRQPPAPSAYPSSQYLGRQSNAAQYTPNNARPSYSSQGSYPPQRTPSSSYTERYAANGVAQVTQAAYGQQSTHSYSQYPNTYRPPAAPHPTNFGPQYSTPQPRAPSAPMSTSQTYRGTQSEYPQRAPPPPAYNYGTMPAGGSASPQNHQRPSIPGAVPGPGANQQQRPPLWNQHSSHYGPRGSQEPQTNGVGGTGSGQRSPDEQAAATSKPKIQSAEQQIAVHRQGSHTPQPTTVPKPEPNGAPPPTA